MMGLRTVQLAGILAEGERDSCVIWADKDRLMEVRVTGVRQREVIARIAVILTTTVPPDASEAPGDLVAPMRRLVERQIAMGHLPGGWRHTLRGGMPQVTAG